MSDAVRLAKRVAEMLPCSRAEAERYIEGGWVTVNGVIVETPEARVTNEDIRLRAGAHAEPAALVTLVFHQAPTATLADVAIPSFAQHWPDDTSSIRPLQRHLARLTAPLPLDLNAAGMVVLTQDYRVMRKLVDESATVEQEYIVDVTGDLGPHGMKQLNLPLRFNGKLGEAAKVSWQNETRLRVAQKGAAQGQVTHLIKSVGLNIVSMKRIRIGRVAMAKLPVGQWRYAAAGERF